MGEQGTELLLLRLAGRAVCYVNQEVPPSEKPAEREELKRIEFEEEAAAFD